MKDFLSQFSKLIKFRLTFTVVFSASVAYLIGCKELEHRGLITEIDWVKWLMLVVGGFLVTSSANGFNEIIEKDLDILMTRTKDRPIPAKQMTTGQALILSILMGIVGTVLLGKLSLTTGFLSVFSILLYAFVYTPLKRKSPIAVFVGAIPGALPPLIGYVASQALGQQGHEISTLGLLLFAIQFIWQFPHFWAIAWVLDDDYKKAGFRLLPTTHRDSISALITFISALLLIPMAYLPYFYGFNHVIYFIFTLILSLIFAYFAFELLKYKDIKSAKKLMFASFFYLPAIQLALYFTFIN